MTAKYRLSWQSLNRSKFLHPFLVLFQIVFRYTFVHFLFGLQKVLHGCREVQLFFRDPPYLLRRQTLNTTSERHHRGIPNTEEEQIWLKMNNTHFNITNNIHLTKYDTFKPVHCIEQLAKETTKGQADT